MNHHPEEHCHTNHDAIVHNTRSKRRDIEGATPSPNEASTLDDAPHTPVMNAQPNVAPQQKQDTKKGSLMILKSLPFSHQSLLLPSL